MKQLSRATATAVGFSILGLSFSSESLADFLLDRVETNIVAVAGASWGLGVFSDTEQDYDPSLRLLDDGEVSAEIGGVDPQSGTSAAANAQADYALDIFGSPGTIITSGHASGLARQTGQGSASASSSSTMAIYFELTSAYSYSITGAGTIEPGSLPSGTYIFLGGVEGNIFELNGDNPFNTAQSGVLEAGTYYLVAQASGSVGTPDAVESGAILSEQWNYQFEIHPVPIPAAAWLLLSGLGGLVAMRRRRT